jgi:hypothetical protein
MARAYEIIRKLENGELLRVASRDDLGEARKLIESLSFHWPAEYFVRDLRSGKQVNLGKECLADQSQEALTDPSSRCRRSSV